MRRYPLAWFAPLVLALALPHQLAAQGRDRGGLRPSHPGPLAFEYMGPPSSGRFISVAGIPGNDQVYYLGSASGGVWKTADGGDTFQPLFDAEDVQSVGALAVAPSDPSVIWAGTGEAFAVRDADIMGDGVYRSTDGGLTWAHMGLTETGRIGRILIHPADPNTVYVCALGRTTGPQHERGVYRTRDGGKTWTRVLFVDEGTGCSGLSMDAHDPNVLFAGTWSVVMHTWKMDSGGPGSAVWVTRNGGDDWTRLGEAEGLPKSPVGKIDVAVAPSDPNRVYALIQTAAQGSVWRSDDGGRRWQVVSWDRTLIGRAGYYIRIAVNATNADEVLVMNSSPHRSVDGGKTWPLRAGGCGDCHDMWLDPTDGDHWAVTGDGGAGWTTDHGEKYRQVSLPNGQMYHVAVDDQVPYWIYSNRQDDGTMRGPSDRPIRVDNVPSYSTPGSAVGYADRNRARTRGFGGFGGRGGGNGWDAGLGGCESGFTLPVHDDPDIVWASCYADQVTRWDAKLGAARSVSPWMHTLDSEPDALKYRCHWTPPLAIDPFEKETVYYGCNVIFRTRDQGQTWDVISPDLSTQDPSRIAWSGGIPGAEPDSVIGDNLGQFYGEVVFAIAPSPVQRDLIWAGTNDGLVWLTQDGGKHWDKVSTHAAGLEPWGTIRQIAPSTFDAGTAYVTVDYHLMDDRKPYVYEVTDFGRTWKNVTGDLPQDHPLDYLMTVTENPNRKGMLFAGSGHGFYWSMDDGTHWTRLREGLPAAPVSWITVEPRYHDVVVSTYGRGLFVLRDILRLEQSDQGAREAPVYLYAPRPGFRQARRGSAEFLYSLATQPKDTVRFEILKDGQVVRAFEALGAVGLNTATWDLLYDGPDQVALRTKPPYNPHIWEEARFEGRDTRPIIHWGIESPERAGPIAVPGDYTVRMTVDGTALTRPFTVLKDPAIASSEADLVASTETQVRVRDGMNETVGMINRLEEVRKKIEDQLDAAPDSTAPMIADLRALDAKLYDAETHFLSPTDLASDDKWYVSTYRVYMQYVWLSAEVGLGAGDVQGGADYKPTAASLEWLTKIEREKAAGKRAYDGVMQNAVAAFQKKWGDRLRLIADRQ